LTGQAEAPPQGTQQLSAKELEALWINLAARDATQGYRTVWELTAYPEQAVPLLKSQLSPAPELTSERLAGLIRDLDADGFAERQSAYRELAMAGPLAVSVLRKVLGAPASAEVHRSVEKLLEALSDPAPRPEALRCTRALQVLETIGTSPARRVLEALARGAQDAPLTQEAKASVERLNWRGSTP
jgi:hypothetical protein